MKNTRKSTGGWDLRSKTKCVEIKYYPETDPLYIDQSSTTSIESREMSEGVALDYDAQGKLADIDNASTILELKEVILSKLPTQVQTTTSESV